MDCVAQRWDTLILPDTPASPVSIFDLDRTLTKRGTWSLFLLFAARRTAPWRMLLAPAVLGAMVAHGLGLTNRKRLKEFMQSCALGNQVPADRIAALAEAYADHCLKTNIYPEALALIAAERAAGRRVMIATAAHHFYLDAIAARLEIPDVIATRSVWRDGQLCPQIEGENCYAASKLMMIRAHLAGQSIDRAACHIRFYSDHISDLPTFDWADEPVAVNPSQTLARHANERGWQICVWR
jgi:HAD superfamily hydrolase (TIGR01490 family)